MSDCRSILVNLLVIFSIGCTCSAALHCFTCEGVPENDCKYLQSEGGSATVECAPGIIQCYSFRSASGAELKRGCADAVDAPNCDSLKVGDSCDKCTKDLCNSAQLTFDRCASCDSTVDLNCKSASALTPIVECPAPAVTGGGCYLYKSAVGDIRRGCVSTLNRPLLELCSENGSDCKTCAGDECNLKESFQQCYICDSEINPECVDLSQSANLMSLIGTCDYYMESCVSYVIPNGKTVRGCLQQISSYPTYCPSTNCHICSDPMCNNDIFPDDRLLCYQCNSTADPDCNHFQIETDNVPIVCPTFKYDDMCYRYWDADNKIGYRGCLSDADVITDECKRNPERCSMCSSYGCNADYLVRDPRLWCIQCDRNVACMWAYKTPTQMCTEKVAFYEKESCYQYLYPSGTLAKRGCSLDQTELCSTEKCVHCDTPFCNGESFLTQSCIRCTSDQNEDCDQNPADLVGEKCVIDPTYSQRGCYSYRDESNTVHRGCYFDMEDDWRMNCATTHQNRCSRCFGTDCNTNEQGQASILAPPFFLLWLLLVTALGGTNKIN